MLQRAQTLYLSLVLICLGLMFVFPFAEFDSKYLFDTSGAYLLETSQPLKTILPFPIGYLITSLMGLTMFIILQYKKRRIQLILGKLNYLLILGLIVLIYLTIDLVKEQVSGEATQVSYLWSTYLPVVALVFLFLANRGIKKDEELVKSLDRLR